MHATHRRVARGAPYDLMHPQGREKGARGRRVETTRLNE